MGIVGASMAVVLSGHPQSPDVNLPVDEAHLHMKDEACHIRSASNNSVSAAAPMRCPAGKGCLP